MTQYAYALIDGVMRQTAIKELYSKKEPIQVIPLYINTRFKDNYDLGPILVATLDNSNLIAEIKQSWGNSTSLIYTNQYLSTIAEHLSQLITIQNEQGSETLFRFADPLTTWYWLTSYNIDLYPDILGPIQSWQIAKPTANYVARAPITWDTFTNPNTSKQGITLNKLGTAQQEALEQAYQFRLKQKLYQIISTAYPKFFTQYTTDEQIDQWLTQRIQQAKAQYLISEQSIAMWVALCCEYGNQFATDEQGHYQRWLANNPTYKKLPIEVNLQHFFAQRPPITAKNSGDNTLMEQQQ